MPITFKSQATGNLVMLQSTAEALLKLVGKNAAEPGIIEVDDMPRVLAALRSAPADVPTAPVNPETNEPIELPFADQPVSLHQRAAPLVRMLEQAQAGGKPIVWGLEF
ncbi:MAG: DUF1840 domain-containing protein [Aquabacterium sp.]